MKIRYVLRILYVACIICTMIICQINISFSMLGNTIDDVLLNEVYEDRCVEAKKCIVFGCENLISYVDDYKVDTSIVGENRIKYRMKYKKLDWSVERIVRVKDNIPPEISLIGDDVVYICSIASFKDPGVTAVDNYDGDITSKVKKVINDDYIRYEVSDSSNNSSFVYRKLVIDDRTRPIISLKGASVIYHEKGTSFKDPGVNVKDNCDEKIHEKVKVSSLDQLNKVGKYEIVYTVTDVAGNSNSVKRIVYVYDFKTKNVEEYKQSLDYYIASKGYQVSVGYTSLDKNETYYYKEKKIYYGASLIKTLAGLYAYENMKLTDEVKQLVKEAISVSSNSSYKKLVSMIGIDHLRSYGKMIGATHVLTRGDDDFFANTHVLDQITYMKYLYQFVMKKANGEELKSYFINDHYNYLRFGESPLFMHKYGYFGKFFHEVGIVFDKKPYIIVILSEEATNDYPTIFRDLSEKIYYLNDLI